MGADSGRLGTVSGDSSQDVGGRNELLQFDDDDDDNNVSRSHSG